MGGQPEKNEKINTSTVILLHFTCLFPSFPIAKLLLAPQKSRLKMTTTAKFNVVENRFDKLERKSDRWAWGMRDSSKEANSQWIWEGQRLVNEPLFEINWPICATSERQLPYEESKEQSRKSQVLSRQFDFQRWNWRGGNLVFWRQFSKIEKKIIDYWLLMVSNFKTRQTSKFVKLS